MKHRIFKTDLLYTASGQPITNGMFSIDRENIILEVGTNLETNGVQVEYFEGAICPAFINTHCHLELSHLEGKVQQKTNLSGFIKELQSIRNSAEEKVKSAIVVANHAMEKAGIAAVADISNGDSSFLTKTHSSIYYHTFIELFGFDSSRATAVMQKGKELQEKAIQKGLSASIVPHSPYSVSKELFQLIASDTQSAIISIHNQEAGGENELYQKGSGELAEMLLQFGNDLNSFEIRGQNSLPSYLDFFAKTQPLLLVHNTYTSIEDISIAEEKNSELFWCFCPKANLYIEDRLPNLPAFIDQKVKCTLGTDSLASNDTLSIWEEIKTIMLHYPSIELSLLIQWATINGAEFLGIQDKFGSIEIGKKAKVNWLVPSENKRFPTLQVIL